jgi:hypothetical protein
VVADYKLFTPGTPIQNNTIWIIEQIPGFVKRGDVSSFVATRGYWPSFVTFYQKF